MPDLQTTRVSYKETAENCKEMFHHSQPGIQIEMQGLPNSIAFDIIYNLV